MMKLLQKCCLLFITCLSIYSISQAENNAKTSSFLVISDLHFDPFYSCALTTPCPTITALNQASPAQWLSILKQQNAQSSNKDTNNLLLKSAFIAAGQTAQQEHIQFIIVLGDWLGHGFQEKYNYYVPKSQQNYAQFVEKNFQFLAQELQQAVPNTPIYPVIGNNDSLDGNYQSTASGPLYANLKKIWQTLPGKTQLNKSFTQLGYYTALPAPHIKLLVLNSVPFSSLAKSNDKDNQASLEKASQQELLWLQKELKSAEKQHQGVWIAMHIPVGIDSYATLSHWSDNPVSFWQENYTHDFLNTINRYSRQQLIKGIFVAHTHNDGFTIINNAQGQFNTAEIFTPSISPIYGNNPSFKIFEYQSNDGTLINSQTYSINLSKNQANWKKEYDFLQTYGGKNLLSQMNNLSQNLEKNIALKEAYIHYFKANSLADRANIEKHFAYYLCSIKTATIETYESCLHGK